MDLLDLFSAAEKAGTYKRPPQETYAPMTMAELEKVPWNGLTAIGSFSGCGGASTGLRMAGWRVPVAVEFVPAAVECYRANSTATVLDRDIREISGEELLAAANLKHGELDLFEGSPPCSSWSAAGTGQKTRERECPDCNGEGVLHQTIDSEEKVCEQCEGTGRLAGESKKYSDTAQRTDDLFNHYVRLIDEMRPRAFLAENVPGLIAGNAVDYIHHITALMGKLGYRTAAKILNAASYGAATERKRLIFIGIREDVGVYPSFPESRIDKPYTLQEALDAVQEDRPEDVAGSSMEGKAVARSWREKVAAKAEKRELDTEAVPCERCGRPGREHRKERTPGREINWCADGEQGIVTKDYFLLVVPDLDKPCPTITATGSQAGAASVTHPLECRKMTPREAATVMGFPIDFRLTGTREQRYERVGRAVAPPLYRAVGEHLTTLLPKPGTFT